LDDLTRDVLAELLGAALVLHEPSLQIIRGMFARRNREMPQRNVIQAMFPEGSEVIPNPRGTAPGVWVEILAKTSSLAGSRHAGRPSEMKAMFVESVLPRLEAANPGGKLIRRARINCFGLGESHAEELLGDLTPRARSRVGITVHEATITLRIEAHGEGIADCEAKLESAKQIARERLGTAVFGEEDEELEDIVVAMLRSQGATLSTVESGTGGLLASRLTDPAGYSACYLGGSSSFAENRSPNCFHWSRRRQLSSQQRRDGGCAGDLLPQAFGSDFALAVTECPRSEHESHPVPIAFIALAGPDFVDARELNLGGDPAILKSRVVKSTLNLLRLLLLSRDAS